MIPNSAHADPDGFRTDVLEAMRKMRYTAMRYPGGNFASGYHWMDGVGPKDSARPSANWPGRAWSPTSLARMSLSNWRGGWIGRR